MDSSQIKAPTAAHRIALERAEALFERRGVAEIREIEKATLKQIDEKKHKLRELVGESYNDVIKSADAFVSMSSRCQTIVKNVVQIQRGFTAGVIGVSGLAVSGGKSLDSLVPGKSPLDELHAVGSRVKYLVDTPELIWSSLDSGDFLEASRRWLRAKLVHDTLQKQCSKALLMKFPLLQHLWPNVEKLKPQVTDQILQHLCEANPLPPTKAALCLAALASLSSFDSTQVLKTFFDSRETCILQHLRGSQTQIFLPDLTTTIQDVIVQVGDLFLIPKRSPLDDGTGVTSSSRLEQVISEDDVGYSGLLFGSLGDWGGSEGIFEEVEWNHQLSRLKGSLSPITPDAGAEQCRAWLTSVAGKMLDSGTMVLGSCNSLHELSLVEGTVKGLVSDWRARPENEPEGESDAQGDDMTWAEIVESSMNLKVDVWDDVFEKPFRRRALELVESAFHKLERDLQTELTSNLAEINESVPEPLGAAGMTQWCDIVDLDLAGKLSNPEALLASPRRSLVNSRSKRSDSSTRLDAKSRARLIAKMLDDRLADTLDGVVKLLDWCEESKHTNANDGGPVPAFPPSRSGSHRFRAVEKSARRTDLEPQIKAVCETAASALADGLGSRLDSLSTAEDQPSAVESALFVGTLCLEVAGTSQTLPIFVGPPENWRSRGSGEDGSPVRTARTPSTALFTPRSARSRTEATSENIQALQSRFRTVGLKGFQIWATWAAKGLANILSRAVEEDYVFGLVEPPGSWERVVISDGGDVEGSNDQMHFSLPSCPSGTMMMALLGACRELRRVGDHSVSTEVLQLFEWELGGLMCGALEGLLGPGGALSECLNEVGVLQLLLDVRFLRDALSGAQPVSSLSGKPSARPSSRTDLSRRSSGSVRQFTKDAGVNTAALAGRKKLFAGLESALSDRLDPIDWATYEPHLWKIEERFYQRTSVLFGALTQLNPMHAGVSIKLPSTAETNMMNLIPVVPRFQYLPIRAPTSSQRKGPGSATTQATLEAMVSSSSMIDPSGNFSFSNLGSQRVSGANAEQSASASSTFATLQEKLGTGSLGSLGTMIGDKAAEVSALAQQFGDLTSGSSWLSTLSFKGMGRTSGTGSSRS
ncbi:hypothetical protein BSKO_11639 [Bryopsis sp. KO-2023]|nr:hypothetical protein BSKO_11639 [Bryopsis sp. KO-2023]